MLMVNRDPFRRLERPSKKIASRDEENYASELVLMHNETGEHRIQVRFSLLHEHPVICVMLFIVKFT